MVYEMGENLKEETSLKLKTLFEKLFDENKAELVIGFSTYKNISKPQVFKSKEELKSFVFDGFSSQNLSTFLRKFKGKKIGILVKGCDSRSIIALLEEGQVKRDDLTVVGINCPGMLDKRRLKSEFGSNFMVFEGAEEIQIEANAKSTQKERFEYLYEHCKSCKYPDPVFYDYIVEGYKKSKTEDTLGSRIESIEKTDKEERWKYFEAEYSKCIRCYACREACPMCYCEECFVDSQNPRWLSKNFTNTEKQIWSFVRIYHQAGRCTECGSCFASCPEEIDLMYMIGKMNRNIKENYGFETGLKPGAKPAFTTYNPNDPDGFET